MVGPLLTLARSSDILLIGRSNAQIEKELLRRGCGVTRCWTTVAARQRMYRERFAVVLVEPDLGGDDGVGFVVEAKGGNDDPSWLPPGWARVPFVILPERGDDQAVVYWGPDRLEAIEGALALADLVAELATSR